MILIQYLWKSFVWVKVIDSLQGVDVEVSHCHLQTFVVAEMTGFLIIKV